MSQTQAGKWLSTDMATRSLMECLSMWRSHRSPAKPRKPSDVRYTQGACMRASGSAPRSVVVHAGSALRVLHPESSGAIASPVSQDRLLRLSDRADRDPHSYVANTFTRACVCMYEANGWCRAPPRGSWRAWHLDILQPPAARLSA